MREPSPSWNTTRIIYYCPCRIGIETFLPIPESLGAFFRLNRKKYDELKEDGLKQEF